MCIYVFEGVCEIYKGKVQATSSNHSYTNIIKISWNFQNVKFWGNWNIDWIRVPSTVTEEDSILLEIVSDVLLHGLITHYISCINDL